MGYFVWALALVLLLNLLVCWLAFRRQSDHYTDLTYSASFILLVLYGLYQTGEDTSFVALTIAGLVVAWALRLGIFLAKRVRQMGRDQRFDDIRVRFTSLLGFFMLQAVGAFLIASPFLFVAYVHPMKVASPTTLFWVGAALALAGLAIESIADQQKNDFKQQAENKGKFMREGLYSVVRYPNYAGEILFWVGIFLACLPYLSSWGYLTVLSPLFITYVLLFVSGIPYVRKGHEEKYGDQPAFQQYKNETARLIPGLY